MLVTPKPKPRTTTRRPPPPPPPTRQARPILDGLAWLWQQWQETAPGPGGAAGTRSRPGSQPSSQPTSSGGGGYFFGSGPFIGNADSEDTENPGNRVNILDNFV